MSTTITFENLPDELLMMIFQYTDDVFTLLKTYLGLNQRLNKILLDKRLHLLTNFLHINYRDDYYNCDLFQQVIKQLLLINTQINDEKLNELFGPLIRFHIQQKCIDSEREYQSSIENFQLIRQQFSYDELRQVDRELQIQFGYLDRNAPSNERIKSINSLIRKKGARLECENYELSGFNLACAINQLLLIYTNDNNFQCSITFNSLLSLFKTLIISNPFLIKNLDYVGNGGAQVMFFLCHSIYCLNSYFHSSSRLPVNVNCYRALVDLYLFVLQASKQINDDKDYLFDVLYDISQVPGDLFVRISQYEIFKIAIDTYIMKLDQPWDDYSENSFRYGVRGLLKARRIDLIECIYRHSQFEPIFQNPDYTLEWINIISKNQSERRFYLSKIDDRSMEFLRSNKYLIFILLDKKERKLLEKIIKIRPDSLNQLDQDGNDPLLYISLKVSGCRHRIVQFLIKMGANLQRRNAHGQNFLDTLQLPKNKSLLENLLEHEIINIEL